MPSAAGPTGAPSSHRHRVLTHRQVCPPPAACTGRVTTRACKSPYDTHPIVWSREGWAECPPLPRVGLMKVLRLAPRLLENLLHVLVLRVLLDAEGRVVANAVRVLPVGPSTTHVRPAIVPDPTEGISSGINTDLSQCVITHCSDPGVSQAPACRRHQSAHWPGPCCSCRSSAGPLSPVTTARAERGERRPGVSRRASEELSASGGASSDRPVGGPHGYSWLRPLRTMSETG